MNIWKKYFKRPIVKNEDLRGRTQCLVCYRIIFSVMIGVVFFLVVCLIDMNPEAKQKIYAGLSAVLGQFYLIKTAIKDGWEDYSELVVTLNTILATVVIFFYSVQDSRKSGISHRAIMAYSKGSFAIPLLFFLTFITCPLMFLFYEMDMRWSAYYCMVVTYVIEVYISSLILISTSFQYNVHVLCNVEIRQFQALRELDENRVKINTKEDYKGNPLYVWTYILHHIEDVIKSDELISDKLIVIKRLIRVPFYENEFSLSERVVNIVGRFFGQNILENKIKASFVVTLGDNDPERVYEFYYYNILSVLEIQKDTRADEQEKFNMVLYEFMDELTEGYCVYKKQHLNPVRKNYILAISGIMNAILYSDVEKSEDICITMFNNILSKYDNLSEDYMTLLSLYIFYQELLDKVRPSACRVSKISNINKFQEWSVGKEELDYYFYYWSVWMAFTTVSVASSRTVYNDIEKTIIGKEISARKVVAVLNMKKN